MTEVKRGEIEDFRKALPRRPKKIKEEVEKKPIGRPKLYTDINYKENPTEYHQKYYHLKRTDDITCSKCGRTFKKGSKSKHLLTDFHKNKSS